MPAEQEGLKPQPNWRKQLNSLSDAQLESSIRFFQSRLAALPADTNQLPTSDVGTQIDDRDIIGPQRAEQVNSLKKDITVQAGLAAQNQNNIANPGLVISMAERAIELNVAANSDIIDPLRKLGQDESVVRALHARAVELDNNMSLSLPQVVEGLGNYLAIAQTLLLRPKLIESLTRAFERASTALAAAPSSAAQPESTSPDGPIGPIRGAGEQERLQAMEQTKPLDLPPLVEEREVRRPVIKVGAYSEGAYDRPNERSSVNGDSHFEHVYTDKFGKRVVIAGVFDEDEGQVVAQSVSRTVSEAVKNMFLEDFAQGQQPTLESIQQRYLPAAEDAIRESQNIRDEDKKRTGTTATIVYLRETEDGKMEGVYNSVGDSRLYVYVDKNKDFEQISKDQSRAADAVDSNDIPKTGWEFAYYESRRYRTASLSASRTEDAQFVNGAQISLESGELLLLTTRGVHFPLTRPEIARVIMQGLRERFDPEQISKNLVTLVKKMWGQDQELYKVEESRLKGIRSALRGWRNQGSSKHNDRLTLDDATAVVIQLGSERVLETVAPAAAVEEEVQRNAENLGQKAPSVERPPSVPYAEWIALNPRERARLTSEAAGTMPDSETPA